MCLNLECALVFFLCVLATRSGADPFKYVVRLNADVMSSDGSSSMATACAGSLALMHAGVPIARHVAGISIGLITTEENATPENSILLTDILGIEDHYGDMDFKVRGHRFARKHTLLTCWAREY